MYQCSTNSTSKSTQLLVSINTTQTILTIVCPDDTGFGSCPIDFPSPFISKLCNVHPPATGLSASHPPLNNPSPVILGLSTISITEFLTNQHIFISMLNMSKSFWSTHKYYIYRTKNELTWYQQRNNEKVLREMQTLCAGCSKAAPKMFALSQTPSRGCGTAKIESANHWITTFTYKPSLVRIDACNFELLW